MQNFVKYRGRPIERALGRGAVHYDNKSYEKWRPSNQEEPNNKGYRGGRANLALQRSFARIVVHPGHGDFPNRSVRDHDDRQRKEEEDNEDQQDQVSLIDFRNHELDTSR